MKTQSTLKAAAIATGGALALTLAACSSATDPATDTSATGEDGGGAEVPTGVTISLWHNASDSQALLDLYAAYEAASGNTIELVTLPSDGYPNAIQTKWATGERPDLLEFHPNPQDMLQLNAKENMIDLSSMAFVAASEGLADTVGNLDGTVYAAVLGPLASFGIFYNMDVFEEAGVEPPTSYGDLLAACGDLTGTGADGVFMGGGSEFPIQMLTAFTYATDWNEGDSYGLGVAAGEIKVNADDSPILGGLEYLVDLQEADCMNADATTATFQDAVAAVGSGEAAATILPSDFINMFVDAGAAETVGFGAITASEGRVSYAASLLGTYFAPKTGDADREAVALDFINFATGDGYQDYVDAAQATPTLNTATAPELDGMFAQLSAQLESPTRTPTVNRSIPGFGNYGKLAATVLAGQSTPTDAVDEFQTYIDQAIAAQG